MGFEKGIVYRPALEAFTHSVYVYCDTTADETFYYVAI